MALHEALMPTTGTPQVTGEYAVPSPARPGMKEIPYDYVAKFVLTGSPGTRVQDVINISTDGAFVAAAIGYSFVPKHDRLRVVLDAIGAAAAGAFPAVAGVLTPLLFRPPQEALVDGYALTACLALRLCGIQFKYSIVDSGTGRELQNQPIHSIAGLGEPNGKRPFRTLAKPILYMPRSTIRIEIEELSQGALYAGGELFLVLHGFKVLGYGAGVP